MAIIIDEIIGVGYDNLSEAQIDKSPSEVVITDNRSEKFYIVSSDKFNNELHWTDYKVVVEDGE